MKRHRWTSIGVATVAAVCAAAWLLAPEAVSQSETSVYVTNFPDVQTVRGTVSVLGLESFGSLAETGPVNVTPVLRRVTTRLIDGGVIETDGFSQMVLSLIGEVRGELTRAGTVGAILIPDTEDADKYLKTRGIYVFPEEVSAALDPNGDPVFTAGPRRVLVAFPRYRVLFYNSTDKTVIASLSAYRTK